MTTLRSAVSLVADTWRYLGWLLVLAWLASRRRAEIEPDGDDPLFV